ncbi:MAG TPA: hypothetical protein VFI16_00810 [Anaeromyxobacteraceae bacterium]|nr:hypothetical protein [Anaeromyxobacteraceae bacterium]
MSSVPSGGRELPIAADFAGASVPASDAEDVLVRLAEGGAAEDVVVVTRRGS